LRVNLNQCTRLDVATGKQDHHFIPRFYSKRWARSGNLCEFSRPHDVVKPRRTSPKGTGYVSKLYSIDDDDEMRPNRLEEEFFKPVDTGAADALVLLEGDIANDAWPLRLRLAWARFVMTLLMRMPEDMATMEASYRKEFAYLTEEQERQWTARRKPHWPVTLEAALAGLDVKAAAGQAKEVATKLMQNERVTTKLAAMHWQAVDVSSARGLLLTSDRPVQLRSKLGEGTAQLILPTGPSRLFIAGGNRKQTADIVSRRPDQLVARSNRAVTEAAHQYVYGIDDSALDFVRRHFGRVRPKTLLQQVVEHVAAKRGPKSG
jgi:hypothetical protein